MGYEVNLANIAGSINSLSTSSVSALNNLIPNSSNSYDLGSSSNTWRNVYTNDLHLNNESRAGNDIDGTTGNWTIQEGENDLFIINNKTGKKYRFKLEEV